MNKKLNADWEQFDCITHTIADEHSLAHSFMILLFIPNKVCQLTNVTLEFLIILLPLLPPPSATTTYSLLLSYEKKQIDNWKMIHNKATNRLCDSALYCLLIFTLCSSWSWKIKFDVWKASNPFLDFHFNIFDINHLLSCLLLFSIWRSFKLFLQRKKYFTLLML